MNANKKPTRLVIEYRALLEEKKLLFYFFDAHEMIESFSSKIEDDGSALDLNDSYKNTMEKYGISKVNDVELVLNSFDLSFNQITFKDKVSSTRVTKNFLIDTYGFDWESKFIFADSKLGLESKSTLETYFTVPSERVVEIINTLEKIGITSCKVFLISEYIAKYFRNKNLSSGLFVIEEENFSIASIFSNKQIIGCTIISNNKKVDSQLLSVENFVTSFGFRVLVENEINIQNVYCSKAPSDEYLKTKEPEVIEDFNYCDLYLSPVSKNETDLSTIKQAKVSEKKKKSSFFSFSLSKKKAFTLVEAAVSLTIFSIVSLLVVSFISVFSRINTDAKRLVLADSYLKTVNTLFQVDPSEENIAELTAYRESDLVGKPHVCFLNESMDINKVSDDDTDMLFRVDFTYNVTPVKTDYIKYEFKITNISAIDGGKSYCGETNFVKVQ